jgi:hypothetical protein
MPIQFTIKQNIIIVSMKGILSATDIDTFAEYLKNLENDYYKLLFDLREMDRPAPSIISSIINELNTFEKISNEKILASSIVISNESIESVLNLIFKFKKPTTPTKITSNLTDACTFLNAY